jgi:uncharacterized surface protein with fasciclin (FAS1) repeats
MKLLQNLAVALVVTVLALPAVAQESDYTWSHSLRHSDLFDTVKSTSGHELFVKAVEASGLESQLRSQGPYTVFIPTDEALSRYAQDKGINLNRPQNQQLADILRYHIVPGYLAGTDLYVVPAATTLQGDPVSLSVKGGHAYVDGARVIGSDVSASNGYIYVIDGVLTPGDGTYAEKAPRPAPQTLLETASKEGSYNTFVKAVKAAGLQDKLQSGHYTVFAPTDQAFAKLPKGSVESLLKPENRHQLEHFLNSHIVPGRVVQEDLAIEGKATAASGETLHVSESGRTFKVEQAKVVEANTAPSNGVLYGVDSVVLTDEGMASGR